MKVLIDLPSGFTYEYVKDGIRNANWDMAVPFLKMAYDALTAGIQLPDEKIEYVVSVSGDASKIYGVNETGSLLGEIGEKAFGTKEEALKHAEKLMSELPGSGMLPYVKEVRKMDAAILGEKAVFGKLPGEPDYSVEEGPGGIVLHAADSASTIYRLKTDRAAIVSAFLQVDDTETAERFAKIAGEETKSGKPYYGCWYPSSGRFQSSRNAFVRVIDSFMPEEYSEEDMDKAVEEAKEFVKKEYPRYLEDYIGWLGNGYAEYEAREDPEDLDKYVAELRLRLDLLREEKAGLGFSECRGGAADGEEEG